jgi:hypothetical protein
MAITRLGLTGPMAAYGAFTAKTASVSTIGASEITGTFAPADAISGSYAPSDALTGTSAPSDAITGTVE